MLLIEFKILIDKLSLSIWTPFGFHHILRNDFPNKGGILCIIVTIDDSLVLINLPFVLETPVTKTTEASFLLFVDSEKLLNIIRIVYLPEILDIGLILLSFYKNCTTMTNSENSRCLMPIFNISF